MSQFYRNNGIRSFQNSPVKDIEHHEYAEQLFKAACILDTLVNEKGYNVMIHDTCGVSRTATLFLIYLALFLKHKSWNNIYELQKYLKVEYDKGVPNMEMVKTVVENNKDFQNK